MFENALGSALIVKSPFLEHKNKKVNTIIESVDIYPTLLELTNIPSNEKLDGESFVKAMEEKKSSENDVAYSYFKNGISMRTSNYRLTKYFREDEPRIELYDHTDNSLEKINIAQEPARIGQRTDAPS